MLAHLGQKLTAFRRVSCRLDESKCTKPDNLQKRKESSFACRHYLFPSSAPVTVAPKNPTGVPLRQKSYASPTSATESAEPRPISANVPSVEPAIGQNIA